ncbi:MAG: YtxH domain-containing protein [Fimbriimonadales bacterium]
MSESEDRNAMLYLLAGVGIGALIGVAAGMLFAPKPGLETREELREKLKEIKEKTDQWVAEQKAKRQQVAKSEEASS